MKSEAAVQIQLTFVDTVVAETRSDALAAPVLIGRDPSADWQAPSGDRTMPARAAVLQVRDGRPVLKAEPGQTFRLNAVVTRERTLQAGDRIAIGDCELHVTAVRVLRTYARYHRLEPLVSERRGVFVDLNDEAFSVGSAEGSGLRLADDTVSRHHATLLQRGDECWVRDGSSRNGTFVNGQRLGGKERLLHDGDVLSFGPFEYRFLDRTVSHVRTSTAKGVLIALATLLLGGGGWWAFYQSTPDASRYLLAASQFACAERFDDAERMLQEAATARQADENEILLRRMRERCAIWRTTARVWADFRDNLSRQRFGAANDQIGQLALDNPDNWSWNEDLRDAHLAEAKEAVALVRLAKSFWRACNDSDLPEAALATLTKERRQRGLDRPDFEKDDRPWMQALKQHLRSRIAGFDENEALFVALTNETARMARGETNPREVRAFAEDIEKKSAGHVRVIAHLMLAPLARLETDRQTLESDARALVECNNAAYSGRHLVTQPDDCTYFPSLMRCQTQNVERRRELDLASLELRAMEKRLVAYGVSKGSEPPALTAFEDTNRVERAFRCELLKGKNPPRLDRTKPVDDTYDRLFGYEFLYSYMEEGYFAYPKIVDPERLNHPGFMPELQRLNALADELQADLKALKGKEFDCIRKGAFVKRIGVLEDWVRRIVAVRDRFDAIADDPVKTFTRRGILARGAALYLTPHAEITKEDWEDFRRRNVWQRENVRARAEEIDPTNPQKTREIVDWIMSRGIPGSPAVKKAWNCQ